MKASVSFGGPIGRISPRLYGNFAEHLGRCSYDGLWVGPSSPVRNIEGFHAGVIEALRDLPVPMLRWPGGCYADHYHWRDGIGEPGQRPGTLGLSCGTAVPDSNALGTHEFLRLCELIGAEPYLAGNVGTGTVQELLDWVTYVNAAADSTLTRARAANGRARPWGVKLWGIGNETWDCGGRYDAASYAHEYRRYASMLRHVDPTAELVAVGLEDETLPESHLDNEWNAHFFAAISPSHDLVDHLSVHKYWIHGGPEIDFDEADYYALLAEAASLEGLVVRSARAIASIVPASHHIPIALDEWGVWHPEARNWGPGNVTRREPPTFEQGNTLRDALAAGIALEGFHRQCREVSMANIAQVVNVLQAILMTEGQAVVKTPTYHAFALHRPHIDAEALVTEVATDAALPDGRPAVSGTASRASTGRAVTLINQHFSDAVSTSVELPGATLLRASILQADAPNATNDVRHPERVAPRPLEVVGADWTFRFDLPPYSMATLEFKMAGGTS
jgi:alpha-N-arabinofuranosidase